MMSAIREIVIPKSVKTIGVDVFYECKSLANIVFEENSELVDIGNRALGSCINLHNINLPRSLKTIGEQCFARSGIKEIILPNSVVYMGSNAFLDCK